MDSTEKIKRPKFVWFVIVVSGLLLLYTPLEIASAFLIFYVAPEAAQEFSKSLPVWIFGLVFTVPYLGIFIGFLRRLPWAHKLAVWTGVANTVRFSLVYLWAAGDGSQLGPCAAFVFIAIILAVGVWFYNRLRRQEIYDYFMSERTVEIEDVFR